MEVNSIHSCLISPLGWELLGWGGAQCIYLAFLLCSPETKQEVVQHPRGVGDGVRKKKGKMKESIHWPERGGWEGLRTGVARTEGGN